MEEYGAFVKHYLKDMVFDFEIGSAHLTITNISKEFPKKNWYVSEHYHSDYELHIIESGRGFICVDGEEFIVNEQELFLTGPKVVHRQFSDTRHPMTELCIEFSLQPRENVKYYEETRQLVKILSNRYLHAFRYNINLQNIFYEIVNNLEKRPIGYYLYTQTLLMQIIIDVIRLLSTDLTANYHVPHKSIDEDRIDQIKRYVEVELSNGIDIKLLQQMLGIGSKQINRIMKKYLGKTLNEYVACYRYETACNMLRTTNMNIESIALESGFTCAKQMSRTFKKMSGFSPSTIRAMQSEEFSTVLKAEQSEDNMSDGN